MIRLVDEETVDLRFLQNQIQQGLNRREVRRQRIGTDRIRVHQQSERVRVADQGGQFRPPVCSRAGEKTEGRPDALSVSGDLSEAVRGQQRCLLLSGADELDQAKFRL